MPSASESTPIVKRSIPGVQVDTDRTDQQTKQDHANSAYPRRSRQRDRYRKREQHAC